MALFHVRYCSGGATGTARGDGSGNPPAGGRSNPLVGSETADRSKEGACINFDSVVSSVQAAWYVRDEYTRRT